MYVTYMHKLQKTLNIIHPGEYFITGKDELIGTLLGSCISVCLQDSVNLIGGMNHFMLPGRITGNNIMEDKNARYGITAINKLMDEILSKGGLRKNLTAKIFGGGSILKMARAKNMPNMIPADNIRVARLLMEMEDIPITAIDVGGSFTRKIIFDVYSGRVYLRKIKGEGTSSLVSMRDEQLYNNITKNL